MNYSNITSTPHQAEQHKQLSTKIDDQHLLVLTFHTNGETQYRIIDNPDFYTMSDCDNSENDEADNSENVGCPLLNMLLLFDEYVVAIERWERVGTVQSTLDMEIARDRYEFSVADWHEWECSCE